MAPSKISIPLEIFNLARNLDVFWIFGPSGRDSDGGNSENRDSEGRDSESKGFRNRQIHGPLKFRHPLGSPWLSEHNHSLDVLGKRPYHHIQLNTEAFHISQALVGRFLMGLVFPFFLVTRPSYHRPLSRDKCCNTWVHANGGISSAGVACVCVHFRAFCTFLVRFCAFFSCQNGLQKNVICLEFCKNVQKALLCNTPFSYTPFCVSPKYPCRTVFPVASQTITATPPLLSVKLAYRNPKPNKGGIAEKNLPLKPIALCRASREIVSPSALEWPLSSGCRKRSAAKGVRSLFFVFGILSVTFSDASVTFFVTFLPNSFCRTPFCGRVISSSFFLFCFVSSLLFCLF